MNVKVAWSWAILTLVPTWIGCSNSPSIVRGQDPSFPSAVHNEPGAPVGHHFAFQNWATNHVRKHHDHKFGPIKTYAGDSANYAGGGCPQGCPGDPYGNGQYGDPYGGNGGPGWYPTHHHWFTYREPRDLVYPQQNSPGAVVQYPYYTTKGPDDFFLDKSPPSP